MPMLETVVKLVSSCLFLLRYERDFMLSLSDNNQADDAHFKISRNLLNMDTPYLNKWLVTYTPHNFSLLK